MVPGYLGVRSTISMVRRMDIHGWSLDTLDTAILFQVPCVDDCPCIIHVWSLDTLDIGVLYPWSEGWISIDDLRMVPGYRNSSKVSL